MGGGRDFARAVRRAPVDHRDQKSVRRRVAGKYHAPNVRLSAECADLLDRLLCVDKVRRLTASEALRHPFLGSLREREPRRRGGVRSRSRERERNNGGASGHRSGGLRPRTSGNGARVNRTPIGWRRALDAALVPRAVGETGELSRRAPLRAALDRALGTDLETRFVREGDLLIKEGDVAEEVFLIKKGRVAVETRVGGATVTVATRGEGEFVGETRADVGAEAEKEIADEGDFGYNPDAKRETRREGDTTRVSAFDARANALRTSPTARVRGRPRRNPRTGAPRRRGRARAGGRHRGGDERRADALAAGPRLRRGLRADERGGGQTPRAGARDAHGDLLERAPDVHTYTPTPLPRSRARGDG